jgi:hypothetical protein
MVLSPIVHRLCAICCLLFLPSSEAMFNWRDQTWIVYIYDISRFRLVTYKSYSQ